MALNKLTQPGKKIDRLRRQHGLSRFRYLNHNSRISLRDLQALNFSSNSCVILSQPPRHKAAESGDQANNMKNTDL